jgi:DMSO/TMAO reductase YedYZ molybdopterin-dependent catalytic subunit
MVIRPLGRRELLQQGGAAVAAVLVAGCGKESGDTAGGDFVGPEEIAPITAVEDFYIVAHFGVAQVDEDTWSLSVKRLGEEVGSFDYAFLGTLEAREVEHTLQCIESRPAAMRMGNAVWMGLPMVEVLEAAGIDFDPEATHIRFNCADGFTMGLPVEDLERPLWWVWKMNDERLPPAHGFPMRALSPGRFGWLNPKQITSVDFTDSAYELPWLDQLEAYMEAAGMDPDSDGAATDLQVQCLISHPTDFQFVEGGKKIRVLGKAYAGSDPVEWVAVSTDGGETFEEAELTYAPGADRWALWRFIWEPDAAGRYEVKVKCRTASGLETDADALENRIPFAGGMAVSVEIL